MAPEIAMLLGVVIGAVASGVTAYFVNQAAQRAEDRRLGASLDAQGQRQDAEFQHRRQEAEQQAAREVREARLKPGLEFLEEVHGSLTAAVEEYLLDLAREQTDGFEDMDQEEWQVLKDRVLKHKPPAFFDLVPRYWRMVASYPMQGLRKDFFQLMLEVPKVPGMSPQERDDLARQVESIRRRIDAEIIRGEWP